MSDDAYRPIADYAFLSDCHSTALVNSHGSIDWACLRRFDASSAFGRILDAERGGYFSIRPVAEINEVHRRYLPSTMILETTMTTTDGSIRCTDAFAMRRGGGAQPGHELLRRVTGADGEVEVEVIIEVRFDYGATRPWLHLHGDGRYSAVGGDDAVIVHTGLQLDLDRERCRLSGRARLRVDDEASFSMVSQAAHLVDTAAADHARVVEHLETTEHWWTDWSSRTETTGHYAAALERSALVLKGLTCAPTGAIVAAPTTSLPEIPGGAANWDYRYSWIRDSTLALESLAEVGHHEVAQGFHDFVMRSSAGHGDELQIMFGPYGERRLSELELDLEGWHRSSPVRIGNAAAGQTQLDVYGHLLDAAHRWYLTSQDMDDDEWSFLASVVDQAAAHRNDADSGIWEMRGAPQHFVQSKVMIWVALDRGIKLVDEHGFASDAVERWRKARDQVRHDIETRGVDADRGNFVQHYGTTAVDAGLLTLPLVGFVDANDEAMRTTTDVIMDELGGGPYGFLRRYRRDGDDDINGGDINGGDTNGGEGTGDTEGVFLLCSFWLVQVLALQGRIGEATELFEHLLGVANDVGLLSEEATEDGTNLLGNFPQAFSHLGLIAAEKQLRNAQA